MFFEVAGIHIQMECPTPQKEEEENACFQMAADC